MKRPFASNRPIGPFAQRGQPEGVTLVYTTSESREFPSNTQIENILEEAYSDARDRGRDDVVVASVDVDRVGSPRADTRGIRVVTDVTIMNLEQFDAVRDVTTDAMRDLGSFTQVAIAVPNP